MLHTSRQGYLYFTAKIVNIKHKSSLSMSDLSICAFITYCLKEAKFIKQRRTAQYDYPLKHNTTKCIIQYSYYREKDTLRHIHNTILSKADIFLIIKLSDLLQKVQIFQTKGIDVSIKRYRCFS